MSAQEPTPLTQAALAAGTYRGTPCLALLHPASAAAAVVTLPRAGAPLARAVALLHAAPSTFLAFAATGEGVELRVTLRPLRAHVAYRLQLPTGAGRVLHAAVHEQAPRRYVTWWLSTGQAHTAEVLTTPQGLSLAITQDAAVPAAAFIPVHTFTGHTWKRYDTDMLQVDDQLELSAGADVQLLPRHTKETFYKHQESLDHQDQQHLEQEESLDHLEQDLEQEEHLEQEVHLDQEQEQEQGVQDESEKTAAEFVKDGDLDHPKG
jgi:hypothetical protein